MSSQTRALIRPLKVLEAETRAVTNVVVSGAVPAKPPSVVYEAFQRKYDIDKHSPRWKRFFFRYVYLPFNRFCFFRLRLIPPDHLSNGELGWLERQGVFSERWRAEQEAEKYPFGGVEPITFDTGESDCTCAPRSIFPNSVARKKYQKHSREEVGVSAAAMQRLKNALAHSERYEHT